MIKPVTSVENALDRLRATLARSDVGLRLLRLTGWTMVAFSLEKAAGLFVILMLAGLLGAQDYGRLTLAQGMVNTLQILILMGAGPVLARFVPAFQKESFRRAVQIISLCVVIASGATMIFVAAALTIGQSAVLQALDLTAGSAVAGWVIAWVALSAGVNLAAATMLAFERGRALGALSGGGAVATVLLVPLLAARLGLTGAVTGLVAVEALKLVAFILLYRRFAAREGGPTLAAPRLHDLSLLGRYGVPVFLSGALWAPTLWLAQLVVSREGAEGLAEVGIFGFANSVLGVVLLLSSLSNRAAVPILSSMQAEGHTAELRRVCGGMALAQLAVAGAIALPLAGLAPWIASAAGPGFAAHWPVLVVMIATGVVLSAQTSLGNYLLVTDRQAFLTLTLLPWAAVLLGAATAFPEHGAYALSIGLLVASILRTALIFARFTASTTARELR